MKSRRALIGIQWWLKYFAVTMFPQVVRDYQENLSNLLLKEGKSERKRKCCTWSFVANKIVTLLLNYPTGLTKAILLAELLNAISSPYKGKGDDGTCKREGSQANVNEKRRFISISELCEREKVELTCLLECSIQLDSRYNFEGSTRVVSLVDKIQSNDKHDEDAPIIEMYLHQKAMCMEQYIFQYPLLMTDLRVRRAENCGKFRLLPTEYLMPILDSNTDKDFITEKFGTLDGIFDEEATPHYTRNILVTIADIGDLETISNPFFESVDYVVLGLIDSDHTRIRMILWDEAITYRRLMSPGDSLGIEDPFSVNDDGDMHLECGPATVFFLIKPNHAPEKAPLHEPAQAQPSHLKYFKKATDGGLDFEMYPYQLISKDVIKDSINISFFGIVRGVSPKEPFHSGEIEGVKFVVDVYDDYGGLEVQVYDSCIKLHEQLYIGHTVLIENVTTDGHSSCTLKTWKSGRLSILSALKGYVASPCMYNISSGQKLKQNGNHFIIGKVSGFQPLNGEYIKKVHEQCLMPVKKSKEGKFFCPHCTSKSLLGLNFGNHAAVKNTPVVWKWRYNIGISVELQDINCTTNLDATERVCEQLLKLSSEDFSKMDIDNERRQALVRPIGKIYVFSVTRFGETKRIDAFEEAYESFLENFKLPNNQKKFI